MRIGVPVFVGIALIGAAFYVRQSEVSKASASDQVIAVVSSEKLRAYQETKDTDGDGVRDWLEELHGTDPMVFDEKIEIVTVSEESGEQSIYKEPTTFTGRFAQAFFKEMILTQAGVEGPPPKTQEALITEAVNTIVHEAQDVLYVQKDIDVLYDTDFVHLREYGNELAFIFTKNLVSDDPEPVILQRALDTNNPDELSKLEPIAHAYQEMENDLQAISVPSSLIKEHLDLLNAVAALREDVAAMQRAFIDPLYTMARMKRYEDDADGLYLSLNNMRAIFERENIFYTDDELGSLFFNVES